MISSRVYIFCVNSPLGIFGCWRKLHAATYSKEFPIFSFVFHVSFSRAAEPRATHHRSSINKIYWGVLEVFRHVRKIANLFCVRFKQFHLSLPASSSHNDSWCFELISISKRLITSRTPCFSKLL